MRMLQCANLQVGAIGNGHMIISNVLIGGLVLRYQRILPLCSLTVQPYIEGPRVDGMWFGILPGCGELNIKDTKIGEFKQVCDTMDKLDPTYGLRIKTEDIRCVEGMGDTTIGTYATSQG